LLRLRSWRRQSDDRRPTSAHFHHFWIGVAVLLGCTASLADGSGWTRVTGSVGPQIEVLRASAKPSDGGATKVKVTWRRLQGDSILETASEVDCETLVLRSLPSTLSKDWLFAEKPGSTSVEPSAERPVIHAYFGSPEGLVVSFACTLVRPDVLERIKRSDGLCDSVRFRDNRTCMTGDIRANTRLFMDRTLELESVCNESPESIEILQSTYLREAEACADIYCAEGAIAAGLRAVSKDLELEPERRARACTAVVNARRLTEERELARRQEMSLLDYRVCASSQVKMLDDRVSPVDVMARRVHDACTVQMRAVLDAFSPVITEDEFHSKMGPRLMELVHQNRSRKP